MPSHTAELAQAANARGLARRDLLVAALALATGSLDVIGFTRLGSVFTSVTPPTPLAPCAGGNRDQLRPDEHEDSVGYCGSQGDPLSDCRRPERRSARTAEPDGDAASSRLHTGTQAAKVLQVRQRAISSRETSEPTPGGL